MKHFEFACLTTGNANLFANRHGRYRVRVLERAPTLFLAQLPNLARPIQTARYHALRFLMHRQTRDRVLMALKYSHTLARLDRPAPDAGVIAAREHLITRCHHVDGLDGAGVASYLQTLVDGRLDVNEFDRFVK